MNDYFKGILMGIIITLLLITMMGFSGGGLGTRFNPMYVKIVNLKGVGMVIDLSLPSLITICITIIIIVVIHNKGRSK